MSLKEKILSIIKNSNADFFTAKQLCGILRTTSTTERRIVSEVLAELVEDCELVFDEKNRRYRLVREGDYGRAIFEANAHGYGFLLREEGDLFVPASRTNGAFHRDTVLYRRLEKTDDCAEIVKIISRGITQLVGTYDKSNNARFVIPDDRKFASDVYILPKRDLNAQNGQKVVVKIVNFPKDNRNSPEGEIVQILGYPDEKNVDMLSVAYAYGLSGHFPDECEYRAAQLPQSVSESDLRGRRDLRDSAIFTIDGEDAKDLDDAVSIVAHDNGTFTLGVHIADVSHYVTPQDCIDKEAFLRGTSVYFPQMVFPMLPTALSNGVCSLYEGVARLTLSCEMMVDGRGKITDCEIFPSVICSKHRLTYTEVAAIFDGNGEMREKYADILPDLLAMGRLAEILHNKRDRRGNIDFETKEVYFLHDSEGNVVDIVPRENTFAHRLIEEFMIAANESVAEYAASMSLPFVYRVHEKPSADKYENLLALMRGVGIKVKPSQAIHSSVLQDALSQAKNTPYFHLINDVMLRTMQKAKYSQVNSGHFGLTSNCYCHFTSPIRRYPDLVVHRILKASLSGKMTAKALTDYEIMAEETARQGSIREKIADEAERKADDVKRCAYAERIVGQNFAAIISGVTERGIFCQLPNTVEGFISVDNLGGSFRYDAERFCLFNSAVRYSLGDPVEIVVDSVHRESCRIDFLLAKH